MCVFQAGRDGEIVEGFSPDQREPGASAKHRKRGKTPHGRLAEDHR